MKIGKNFLPYIEIVAFHFLVYLVFYYLKPNRHSFFFLNPHPLLIGVIVFSIFYGNRIGVFVTVSSIIMYGLLFYTYNDEWLPLVTEIDYFKLPLSFFGVGTTIGIIVDNYKTKQMELKDDLAVKVKDLRLTTSQYELSQKALTQLQKQIIDSDESIIALYDVAKRLQKLDEDEILTETVGIMSKYLESSHLVIYNYNAGQSNMRFLLGKGISEDFSEYSINIEQEPFYKKVLEEKQVLRYSDGEYTKYPLMVGPIIKNNNVIGLVMIKEMNFDFISNYAFTLFKIILDWVNQSLNNVMLIEKKQEKYIKDTQILTYKWFEKRLNAERRRYKEYGLKYVLFAVKAPKKPLSYAKNIKENIRMIDEVTVKNKKIYVLLPATDIEKYPNIREIICSRMKFELKQVKTGDDFK